MKAPLPKYTLTCERFLERTDARVASLPYDELKWELFNAIAEMQERESRRHAGGEAVSHNYESRGHFP